MAHTPLKYRAFISYSHADEKLATRLHHRLESFKPPRKADQEGNDRRRLRPVFRDRLELATSSRLTDAIEQALSQSDALIVVCSPAAHRSKWVNEEIRFFRTRFPDRPVLSFVVAGRPEADPRTSDEASFPLRLVLEDADDEHSAIVDPLAADARREGDGFQVALLKLIAGLIGVGFDDLWRREQKATQRRWATLAGLSLSLSIVFGVLTWQAMVARDAAERAEAVAQLELTAEQQTRRFLLSIFRLSDAGEARGENVTVRSVLDRAVSTIDATDFTKPVVKSRLLTTMGQAYSSLGLNRRSLGLLERSIELLEENTPEDIRQRIASHIELAEVHLDMGEYDLASAELDVARQEIVQSDGDHSVQLAELENVAGEVFTYSGQTESARDAFGRALQLSDAGGANAEAIASIRGRSLGGFGLLEFYENNPAGAVEYFEQAHRTLRDVFGNAHPDTNWALGSLGSVAWADGRIQLARSSFTSALDYARVMYDPGSPEIGTLQNNLARLLLEQGDIARAGELLEQALISDRTHRADDFDGLVYTLNNLAIVRIAEGRFGTAGTLLEEALTIGETIDHPVFGSVLTQLADVRCEQGLRKEGQKLAERALAAIDERNGKEDWRYARARMTHHFCRREPLRSEDQTALLEHWGAGNPFVLRSERQAEASLSSR